MTALNTLHQPPFDVLTDAERKELAQHSTMVFLPEGENLPSAWRGDTFVIIKGKLRQSKDDELIAGLHTHDWFVFSDDDFSTSEECLLYRINGEGLRTISEKNSTLKNLLFADLSARLSTQATRHDYREGRSLLHKAIGDMGEHIKAPHFVAETTSIQAAAAIMNEQHAKHVLVNGADGRVGVFTQTDICLAVGRGADLSQAIAPLTNFTISTIHHAQELSEALLIMTEQKIHRLPVVDDLGQIIGVLGQSELLSFLTNHSGLISSKIDQASDIDALSSCVQMIGKLIRHQTDTGVKIHAICRTVQTLNAQIFAKLWQLIVPNDVYQNTCLFVMGSEGRGEQIMRTDQDNALIIKDGFVCDELPQYAKTFNDTLADMGYPYCDGGIMLCN
ncbi:MAG: DUF294 nucleotidyltransferase-like domain-containing protein, partial [Acinetobacter sp.]|nr:DUF294 nucleotidyltransferase-like domain-containing protein [Acinetobacter sp.]